MRLFIAIPVPEDVRDRILVDTAEMRGRYPDLKWTGRDAYHLTLSFLGETEEKMVEPIREAMDKAATNNKTFEMELAGIGSFPKKGPPRVLYVPVVKGFDETKRLHGSLVRALGDLGPQERKKFTPHLTLARIKGKKESPDPRENGNGLHFSFTCSKLVLYRSHLHPEGARYEVIEESELKREEAEK